MKNYVQPGDVISVLAPYAVTAGQGALVGTALFGIACHDAANGAALELAVEGVYDVTSLSTDTNAVGDLLYWDNTNKRLTTTASGNLKVGVAVATKAAAAVTSRILLNEAR